MTQLFTKINGIQLGLNTYPYKIKKNDNPYNFGL